MAKGGGGQLTKVRGFAEVRKQNEYQRKTLAGKGGLTSQRKGTVYSRSKGGEKNNVSADKDEEEKKAAHSTQEAKPNINIIYCPYFLLMFPPDLHMSALSICLLLVNTI